MHSVMKYIPFYAHTCYTKYMQKLEQKYRRQKNRLLFCPDLQNTREH